MKRNQQTGQSRGFAFIRFKDANVARTVLARTHTILGRRVDIRSPKGKVVLNFRENCLLILLIYDLL